MTIKLQERLEIRKIIPEKSYVGEDIIFENKENKLLIYYITRYPTGQPKTKKFQPAKALVHRIITISEEVVENLGMYYGDGQTSIKSKSYQATKFSNSHPVLIKKFVKFLNSLNVKSSDLTAYIKISKIFKLKDKIQKETLEKELISYWTNISGIPKQNFLKLNWDKKDQKSGESRGNLAVIYQNSSFRIVLDSLMNYIKTKAIIKKKIAASFIRGLIAADGCVTNFKSQKLIDIAAKKEENREFIMQSLHRLGMKNVRNDKSGDVEITKYSNFLIAKKYNLCSIHPKKRHRFGEIMEYYDTLLKTNKNLKTYLLSPKNYLQPMYKSKILELLKEEPKSILEISNNFDIKENGLRRYILLLEKEGKIKRINNYLSKPINRTHKTGRTKELWMLSKKKEIYNNSPKQSILKAIQKLQPTYSYQLRKILPFHATTIMQGLHELEIEGKIISRGQKPEEKRKHFPIRKLYEIDPSKLERKNP